MTRARNQKGAAAPDAVLEAGIAVLGRAGAGGGLGARRRRQLLHRLGHAREKLGALTSQVAALEDELAALDELFGVNA